MGYAAKLGGKSGGGSGVSLEFWSCQHPSTAFSNYSSYWADLIDQGWKFYSQITNYYGMIRTSFWKGYTNMITGAGAAPTAIYIASQYSGTVTSETNRYFCLTDDYLSNVTDHSIADGWDGFSMSLFRVSNSATANTLGSFKIEKD